MSPRRVVGMPMSKRLYVAGASLAVLALAAVLAGIWSVDVRWVQTAWSLAAAAFTAGACGGFVNITEARP